MPCGKGERMDKTYEKPSVTDFGDLVELTQGAGSIGAADGIAFTIRANLGPNFLSVGVLP